MISAKGRGHCARKNACFSRGRPAENFALLNEIMYACFRASFVALAHVLTRLQKKPFG